jgi:2-oxoglutarate ferredoxin oxidoreductase subunit alpha
LPANTEALLRGYDKVVVPEMNLGQLSQLLRGRFLIDVIGYNKVRGLPFTAGELESALEEIVKNV